MRKSRLLERLLLALALLPFVVVFALLATGMVRTYRSPTGSMEPAIPIGGRMIAVRIFLHA